MSLQMALWLCVFPSLCTRFLRTSWGMTCASNLLPTGCVSNPSINILIIIQPFHLQGCCVTGGMFEKCVWQKHFFDLRHDCRGGVELQRADSLTTNNAARALMQRCHLGVCKKAIDGCCTFILCQTAGRTVGAYCMVGLQDVQRRNNSEFDHSTEDLGIDLKPRSLISV